ncbi:uncharacterized protein LOC144821906 isoform X2 [Lissotriton helveticus]
MKEKEGFMASKQKVEEQFKAIKNKLVAARQRSVAEFQQLYELLKAQEQAMLRELAEMDRKITMSENAKVAELSGQLSPLDALIMEIQAKCRQSAEGFLQDFRSTLSRCESVKFREPEKIIHEPREPWWNYKARKLRSAKDFLNESIQIEKEKSKPSIHQLQLHRQKIDRDGHLQKCTFGPQKPTYDDKVIMLLGAAGSGKTTLINGMVNYILGVKWEDGFRLKLIEEANQSQAVTQTSSITSYHLIHQEGFQVPYSLTIIDTPGFGDTRGIDRDRFIVEQIREFFSPGGVDHLDAVCFVVQSSLARLTPSHRYIFDSILSIFGKDVADSILVLITFADGQKPPVLEAIREAEMPCLMVNGAPVHFKFNNSALFAYNGCDESAEDAGEDENFDKMFWKMGVKNLKTFLTSLNKLETKSLRLTKEVLDERRKLEVIVEGLQPQIRAGLTKQEEIRKTIAILEQDKDKMQANQNYENARSKVMTSEGIYQQLNEEYAAVEETVAALIDEVSRCLRRLDEIALKPNPRSTPEYIDLLIQSEKEEAKPGYMERIQSLKAVRERAELIARVSRREEVMLTGWGPSSSGKNTRKAYFHNITSWMINK